MKKVIITGASSGLGLEIGKLLKNNGVEVVNISTSNSPFTNIKTDLSNDEDVKSCILEIKQKHADFDVIIFNAGVMYLGKVGDMDFDVDKMFKINITSTIKITNELLNLIKTNDSDVVFVGSTASFKPSTKHSAYSASKHAVQGFLKSLKSELSENKIRVIGFHPGGFNSNLRGGIQRDGYMDAKELANLLINILKLPKSMEVSEIIINRNGS
jgi:NADP-dependent 3-hydroxy acid dehydrogenase YdfG